MTRNQRSDSTINPTVYIETSFIGYLSSRPSRDLITAANQPMTHDWWHNHRGKYEVYVSEAVINECSAGDAVAAQERLDLLAGVPRLDLTFDAENLAASLLSGLLLPAKAKMDALHIAIAAVNGMEYLLTWNCRHIANATLRPRIAEVCQNSGFQPPTICTPQEILEA